MKRIMMSLGLLFLLGSIQAVNEDFFGYIEGPNLESNLLDEVLTPNIIKDLGDVFDQNNNDIKSGVSDVDEIKAPSVNSINYYENSLNSIDNLNDKQIVTTENKDKNLVNTVIVLSKSPSKKRKRTDESASKSKKSKHNSLEKKHKCNYPGCSYSTTQRSQLTTHKMTHTGEKPLKCDYSGCDYATIYPHVLKRHKMRKHDYEKPFKCDQPRCNYSTVESRYLKKHKKNKHGLES